MILEDVQNNSNEIEPIEVTVTVENLAPKKGQTIPPFWFAFHDGSFDYFDAGSPASTAVEINAEDGFTGDPVGRFPPEYLETLIALGVDFSKTPPLEEFLSGEFAASEAALNGGIQDIVISDRLVDPFFGAILPGETLSSTLTLEGDPTDLKFFSYSAMMYPANDAFIGNDDPTEIEVFDDEGNFIGADFIVLGSEVWDAGTEENDEDPSSVIFRIADVFNGIDENGIIQVHSGLRPAGEGGIVDFEFNGEKVFENADFTAEGYQIARITITDSVPPDKIRFAGTEADETIQGRDGDDRLKGNLGDDTIFGSGGNDRLWGDKGSRIKAGGNDTIWGGAGDDVIRGGGGDDVIFGNLGADYLRGDEGDDLLRGGNGDDRLRGDFSRQSNGRDTFVLSVIEGTDTIEDFEIGEDFIGLADGLSFEQLIITQQTRRQTVIEVGDETIAILKNVNADALIASADITFTVIV